MSRALLHMFARFALMGRLLRILIRRGTLLLYSEITLDMSRRVSTELCCHGRHRRGTGYFNTSSGRVPEARVHFTPPRICECCLCRSLNSHSVTTFSRQQFCQASALLRSSSYTKDRHSHQHNMEQHDAHMANGPTDPLKLGSEYVRM